MGSIDYFTMLIALFGVTGVGLAFARRAGKDTDEFILGGRKMPFWLAGASAFAVTLNANTPLVESRKIRNDGIAGIWFRLQGSLSGAMGTIFFSRLWRRAEITTPLEFYQIRYRGRAADTARVMDVLILGIINGVAWGAIGLVAMKKLILVIFDLPPHVMVLGAAIPSDTLVVVTVVGLAMLYATASGVNGVVWTDLFEALIAVLCTYVLLALVLRDVGWNTGLHDRIVSLGDEGTRLLKIWPEFGPAFLVLLIVQPILSQGQYHHMAQRLMCVKDEREVLKTAYFGTLVDTLARNWPVWVMGLAGIFLVSDTYLLEHFPPIVAPSGAEIPDYEMAYPTLVRTYLPTGLLGLALAGFLFAFMSSFDTNLHNGASAFVNDLWRPYVVKQAGPHHYVTVARVAMIVLGLSTIMVGLLVDNLLYLFIFANTVHNSDGVVKVLRWLYWRVNGAMELASRLTGLVAVAFVFSPWGEATKIFLTRHVFGRETNDAFYAVRYLMVVLASSAVGLLVMWLTRPEPMEQLEAFYRRVRPFGWWGKVREANEAWYHGEPVGFLWLAAAAQVGLGVGGTFAILGLALAMWKVFFVAGPVCLASGLFLLHVMRRLYPDRPAGTPEPAA